MDTNITKTIDCTYTDIREKKTFQGCTLSMVRDYGDGFFLFRREGQNTGWELVRGIKFKKKDGSEGLRYPASEQFGTYGRFLPPRCTEKELDELHEKWVYCRENGISLDEYLSVSLNKAVSGAL